MHRRTRPLRFSDVAPQTSRLHFSRPPCFGKEYDPEDRECRIQCPHRAACSPVFQAKFGASVPARRMVDPDDSDEPMPVLVEVDAPEEESFWSKLAYNSGLQTVEALVKECWYAVRSIPRKRYFTRRNDNAHQ